MSLVVVPNSLSEAIYRLVDNQLEKVPTLKPQRENIYKDILRYFDEHGHLPEFTLEHNEPQEHGMTEEEA